MSFSDKLQKVREKPDHVKERILIITMAILVALVVTVWVSNFNFSSFNFKDSGNFINYSKEYFSKSSSKGYIFDETMPTGFMNSLTSSTSTKESTSTQVKTSTTTNTNESTSTKTIIDESTSTETN